MRSKTTAILLLSTSLLLGGCGSMSELNTWIEDNQDKVKMAALGGLGAVTLTGFATHSWLPTIAAGTGGAVIGWHVGDLLYPEEEEAHAESIRLAAKGPTGKDFAWINPERGSRGAVKATEAVRTTAYSDHCRSLQSKIETKEASRIEQMTVCEQKSGVWKVVG